MRAKKKHEEDKKFDVRLETKVIAVAIGCFLAAGAFAQKKDERPPKPPTPWLWPQKAKAATTSTTTRATKRTTTKKEKTKKAV